MRVKWRRANANVLQILLVMTTRSRISSMRARKLTLSDAHAHVHSQACVTFSHVAGTLALRFGIIAALGLGLGQR